MTIFKRGKLNKNLGSLFLVILFLFTVCVTFLKTIALFLIMILAFAMSFYTLNNEDEKKNEDEKDDEETFLDPFMSVITVVRMMLSDFDNV